MTFEWDALKDKRNTEKHGVPFEEALLSFHDADRIIYSDARHSTVNESRFFCIGKVRERIMTVRFTYKDGHVRIIGAGYWRKGRSLYENRT